MLLIISQHLAKIFRQFFLIFKYFLKIFFQPPPYPFDQVQAAMPLHEAGNWWDLEFSIDLVVAAQREAKFLGLIDRKASQLYDDNVLSNAIRRYEQIWLPLQAKYQDAGLIPPLDVHWVWHTHMLSPTHYREDCDRLVGKIVDHR